MVDDAPIGSTEPDTNSVEAQGSPGRAKTVASAGLFTLVGVIVTAVAGLIGPCTAHVNARGRLTLERTQQEHQVRMDYFALAVDPSYEPEYRQSILRFLVEADADDALRRWAVAELERVEAELSEIRSLEERVLELEALSFTERQTIDSLASQVDARTREAAVARGHASAARHRIRELEVEQRALEAQRSAVPAVPCSITSFALDKDSPSVPERQRAEVLCATEGLFASRWPSEEGHHVATFGDGFGNTVTCYAVCDQ